MMGPRKITLFILMMLFISNPGWPYDEEVHYKISVNPSVA